MKLDSAAVKKLFKKADALFNVADEIFNEADKLFDSMDKQTDAMPPKGEPHQHHVRFCSTNVGNRLKMAKQFAGMSVSMLFRGVAHLKFKEKNDKTE